MYTFIVATVILALMGIGCCFAPQMFTKADQRDNPESVENVRKFGPMLIIFAVGAVLLALKYKLT